MSRADDMLKRLQPFMRKSEWYKVIFKADAKILDERAASIEDLRAQFFVDTATWGLDYYEKELGLTANKNKTLDERRAAIKAKMLSAGKVSIALIKSIVDTFTDGQNEVDYDGAAMLHIKISKLSGVDFPGLHAAIDDTKPAHIGVELFLTPGAAAITVIVRSNHFIVDYYVCNSLIAPDIEVPANGVPVFLSAGQVIYIAEE